MNQGWIHSKLRNTTKRKPLVDTVKTEFLSEHNQCLKTLWSAANRATNSRRPRETVYWISWSHVFVQKPHLDKCTALWVTQAHREMPYEVKPDWVSTAGQHIKGFPVQGMNSVFPLSNCPRMGRIISSSNMLICSTERGSYHIAADHSVPVAVAVTTAVVALWPLYWSTAEAVCGLLGIYETHSTPSHSVVAVQVFQRTQLKCAERSRSAEPVRSSRGSWKMYL